MEARNGTEQQVTAAAHTCLPLYLCEGRSVEGFQQQQDNCAVSRAAFPGTDGPESDLSMGLVPPEQPDPAWDIHPCFLEIFEEYSKVILSRSKRW